MTFPCDFALLLGGEPVPPQAVDPIGEVLASGGGWLARLQSDPWIQGALFLVLGAASCYVGTRLVLRVLVAFWPRFWRGERGKSLMELAQYGTGIGLGLTLGTWLAVPRPLLVLLGVTAAGFGQQLHKWVKRHAPGFAASLGETDSGRRAVEGRGQPPGGGDR